MALVEMRSLLLGIHEASHKPSAVRNGKLESRSRCPLVVPSRVVAVPRQDAWNTCIHSSRHHERHSILDVGILAVRDNAVADNGNGQGAKHDWTSELDPVGQECYADSTRCRDSVRGNGPELCLVGIVCKLEVVDDRGQEQAE